MWKISNGIHTTNIMATMARNNYHESYKRDRTEVVVAVVAVPVPVVAVIVPAVVIIRVVVVVLVKMHHG